MVKKQGISVVECCGSVDNLVAGFLKHGNEALVTRKYGEIIDQLSKDTSASYSEQLVEGLCIQIGFCGYSTDIERER